MAEPAKKAKSLTKSAIYKEIASAVDLTPKQVAEVFDELTKLIKRELGKKGPGVLSIPGVVKLTRVQKPATKATTRPNPFKPGEMMTVGPKPASLKVRARALKGLNDLIK